MKLSLKKIKKNLQLTKKNNNLLKNDKKKLNRSWSKKVTKLVKLNTLEKKT